MTNNLMNIPQDKIFKPFEIDDGWTVVLPGEERRRGDKKVIALTKVEIKLHSDADLYTCLKHLEESDRRFSLIKSNPWDWSRVAIKELKVRFSVVWYDKKFFELHRHAYANPKHLTMYTDFGATLHDFSIQHVFIDNEGKESPCI
jgi:hypothetical protein